MSKKPVPGSFCWFECGSRDVAAARKFYVGLFGWDAMDVPMPEGAGNYTLFRIDGGDVGGLYELAGPMFEGVPSHWATYVASDNVDASAEKAKSLGGALMCEPMDIPGVARIAVIQDPTGAVISLFGAGNHTGAAHFGITNSFCWSELATRDTKTAEEFYRRLFPWTLKASTIPGMYYTELLLNGQPIGGMMEMTPQHGDAPPHWLPYVLVVDCDATAQKVTELGGQLIVPPMDIPNTGRFSVFQDPAGAFLAVIKIEFAG